MNKDFWEHLNKLEELAEKVTRSDWDIHVTGDNAYATNVDFHQAGNLRYIAAANPAMILAMIGELKCLLLDNSTANMDLQVARHQAQKMARNNMELHERLTNLQKELNDAKAKLVDKNRRIKILEDDLFSVKEYSRNSDKVERLEKEADWLAEELASVYKSEFEGTMDLLDASGWRKEARKAIAESDNA